MERFRGLGAVRRLLYRQKQLEKDLSDELEFHLLGRYEEYLASGLDPEAAWAEVYRRFGNVGDARSDCRQIGSIWKKKRRRKEKVSFLLSDLRYALRTYRRNPGFTTATVLTLGLGIGATTAAFTVLDTVVIRPLPYDDPESLVRIWDTNLSQGISRDEPSPPNFADWLERNSVFQEMTAWRDGSMTLTEVDQPEVLNGVFASANFFELLDARPAAGRTFGVDDLDSGAVNPPAVISYPLWQSLYGGDPAVFENGTIMLNGFTLDLIGAMPEGFAAPGTHVDVWVPSDYTRTTYDRSSRLLSVMARLSPGMTVAQAQSDMDRIAAQLEEEYPENNAGYGVLVVPLHDEVVGDSARMLFVIFGAVSMVLIVACVNVAGLLLGRSAARRKELAIRTSLGAGRRRVVGQLLTESVVLGLMGGAFGILLALVGVKIFLALEPGVIPRTEEVGLDWRILGFALTVSLGSSLLFGVMPAVKAAGHRAIGVLRGGAVRQGIARQVFVVSEVAISLVLLVGAGLLIRSFTHLQSVDPGFDTEGILAMQVSIDNQRYPGADDKLLYFRQVLDELRSVPGVRGAAVTTTLPMRTSGIDFSLSYRAQGHPVESVPPEADYRIVSPGYLETVGIPLVRGRDFTDQDRADARRVILITQSFADFLWPGEDPIGKTVEIFYAQDQEWEVVGVVGDTRHQGLSVPPAHQMFVPLAQAEFIFGYMTLVVRQGSNDAGVVEGVRAAATAVDSSQPFFDIFTIEEMMSTQVARDRFAALVAALFALLALFLSAAGIYGVVSYQVAQRTQEIGLRMALGASREKVLNHTLIDAGKMAAAGVLVGVFASLLCGRFVQGLLYEVNPVDPTTIASVAVVLVAVTLLASLIPAFRAASVDPINALRTD